MKKPLIALSIVCASALALADTAQYNSSWFAGIGGETADASILELKTTNGSWTFPTTEGAATVDSDSSALVLDLDENEKATFTVSTAAEETETAQALTVTGIFNPIAAEDLLSGAKMADESAQVGFAVVSVTETSAATETEEATTTTAYKYYAWVGGASESADPIADWVELGTATDVDKAKTITIGLSYWTDTVTATFTLGAGSTTATVLAADVPLAGKALEAAAAKKIASISCTGSGTLNALSGAYQYAVAEAEGRKFGTAVEAIAAAQSKGGSGEIKLLKAVSGSVEVSGGLRVWQNDDEALKASVTRSFTHKEETSYPTSATVSAKGYHEWQVNNDVLESVAINGKKIGMGSAGSVLQDAFRTFLEKNCGDAYRSSTVTKDTLAAALNRNGTNGYPLWQSFVMGVDADETVKLAPATTDTEADGIFLKLASTIPASPYDSAIKYTVTKNGGTAGTATAITRTSPVVKIPLETGRYSVKFTIGE